MSKLTEISEALQEGRAKRIATLVPEALAEGVPAQTILEDGLIAGMNVVGRRFRDNEIFVPEVLVAARAMKAGTELLKPHLASAGTESRGKVVIGTVKGDLHDIGKNLVRLMLEGKGLTVVDLDVDVSPEEFVQAAIENDCQVICCSALLTTTMPVMAEVVKRVEAAGIRDKVSIMVGGAPVTESFCTAIGADAYAPDAATAAEVAMRLVG